MSKGVWVNLMKNRNQKQFYPFSTEPYQAHSRNRDLKYIEGREISV